MCVSERVCERERERERRVCVCVRERVCVCERERERDVCVCERERESVCGLRVCVCVCVCVRERFLLNSASSVVYKRDANANYPYISHHQNAFVSERCNERYRSPNPVRIPSNILKINCQSHSRYNNGNLTEHK